MYRHLIVTALILFLLFAANGLTFAADRLKLDDTAIIGTRELPKVLYIVPWKDSNLGSLAGKAETISYDGGMVPLDRDTYAREVEYFNMLRGDAGIGGIAK